MNEWYECMMDNFRCFSPSNNELIKLYKPQPPAVSLLLLDDIISLISSF